MSVVVVVLVVVVLRHAKHVDCEQYVWCGGIDQLGVMGTSRPHLPECCKPDKRLIFSTEIEHSACILETCGLRSSCPAAILSQASHQHRPSQRHV